MRIGELIAFILYFAIVLGMGVYFFVRGRNEQGEKSFFLGGRKMSGLIAALSAGASDMSAWVLMVSSNAVEDMPPPYPSERLPLLW